MREARKIGGTADVLVQLRCRADVARRGSRAGADVMVYDPPYWLALRFNRPDPSGQEG